MARGPRILLYGHDTFGLGHLRRNVTLAHRLARDFPTAHLLALTGSPQAHALPLPPRFDFVKIPSATKDAGGAYRSRALDLSLGELTDLRSRLIAETMLSYRPDVVLVDHAPSGMAGELIHPLDRLRAAHPSVHLVLGLRDVIDEPERVRADWAKADLLSWMDRTYDRVFIYGAPGVGPSPEEYGLSPRLNGRVRHTGYVLWAEPGASREEVRARLGLASGDALVVATVGGGGDGDAVLSSLLTAFAGGERPGMRLVVVTGPLMAGATARALREQAASNPGVTMIEFDPDLPALVAAADCVVSMGGYNSMTELLAAGTPGVIVPRVEPRLEQWIRASAMAQRGLCTLVHPADASPRRLADAVMASLLTGRRTIPLPFRVDGAARVSAEVRELMNEDRAWHQPRAIVA
jgi:predicted glycosyltransferase